MADPAAAHQLLTSFINLYSLSRSRNKPWPVFWKSYFQNHPLPQPTLPDFIANQTSLLSDCLNTLGKDHPLIRKFVSSLPLRLSKTILSFPTTPEMIRELMTD